MSLRKAFLSLLHLFTLFSFGAASVFFIALRLTPALRLKCADFLLVHFAKTLPIGLAFGAIAFLLFLCFYFLDYGSVLTLRMGISADLQLVRQTLEECFSSKLENKISLLDLEISRKQHLDLTVCLREVEKKERAILFAKAEKELGRLLKDRFGYTKPFRLIVKMKKL